MADCVHLQLGEPLAVALKASFGQRYCNHCLKRLDCLKRCSGCMCVWYCSADCQKDDWKLIHQYECKTFKQFQGNLMETVKEKLNGENNAAMFTLIFRLFKLSEHGKLAGSEGKITGRRFSGLMMHEAEMRKNPEKMLLFRVISQFIFSDLITGLDSSATLRIGNELFQIFCKVLINSHSLYSWDPEGNCEQIALALCLDVSAYDHSCIPTAEIRTVRSCTVLVGLQDGIDLRDTTETYIPYVNLMTDRFDRKKFLQENYFFDCQCSRCSSAIDEKHTAIKCEACGKPMGFPSDSASRCSIICATCGVVQSNERIEHTEKLTIRLRNLFGTGIPGSDPPESADLIEAVRLEVTSRHYLSEQNIFYGYLLNDLKEREDLPQKLKQKAWLGYYIVLKNCYPPFSARVVLQEALKTVKTLLMLEQQRLANQIIIQTVYPTAERYFGSNSLNWPFLKYLHYLERCIANQKLPALSIDRILQE